MIYQHPKNKESHWTAKASMKMEREGQGSSARFPVSEKRFHLRNKVDKESIGPNRKASDLV
jgi:hypothetical protein